jgi:hypothetical protein
MAGAEMPTTSLDAIPGEPIGRWRTLKLWEAGVIGLLVAGALLLVVTTVWSLSDVAAYNGAAERLLHGQPLYPPLTDQRSADVYRYAPWFAVAWMPMLVLSAPVRDVLWSVILVAGCVAAAWPMLSHPRLLVTVMGAFAAVWLLGAAKYGNVEPLMVALLVWGIPRRWGPLAVGVAASLKVAPILLVAVWVGRREWGKVVTALVVAAVLLAPMLLFNLSHYPIEATALISIRRAWGDVAWVGSTAALALIAIVLSRTRFAWFAGDLAVLAAYPQLPLYRLGILLVGTQPGAGTKPGAEHVGE